MNPEAEQPLFRALYKMLRPMVRLLMRHGVTYRVFADIARHAYVDVAEEDFALPGRKPSNARIAVLTGINRKDIAKLKERTHPLDTDQAENPNPCARIITAWLNNTRFHNGNGQPLDLPIEDASGAPSFSELVNGFSSDVPVRAMLDELTRIAAVTKKGDLVRLATAGYIPQQDIAENIRIFGTAATDLLSTMDYNIARVGLPFIQRTVSYDNIPLELLERIRVRSRAESEVFLLQINEWLADCDREQNTQLIGSGRARAGIGIYYFEQQTDSENPQDR